VPHEKEIFESVANARSRLIGAGSRDEQIEAANQLTGALGRLLAIAEQYPQLKADQQFARLSDELAGTENRIAVERKRYNDTVQEYNTYIAAAAACTPAGWASRRRSTSKCRRPRSRYRRWISADSGDCGELAIGRFPLAVGAVGGSV
jgi:LemA protein